MVAPAALLLLLLWVAPLAGVAALSFQDSSLLTSSWIGLRNYVEMFRDPHWTTALVNSLIYSALSIVLGVGLGAAVAFPTSGMPKQIRGIVRAAMYLPSISAGIIISQMWLMVFASGGLANAVMGGLGLAPVRWLTERWPAIFVIGCTVQLAIVGTVVVVLGSALEGVPKELREAARLDGASASQVWRYVDLPWVSGAVALMALSGLASGFTMWETPWVLTRGGPDGATATAIYAAWESAFTRQRYGMAAAQSVVLLGVVMAIAGVVQRVRKWVG